MSSVGSMQALEMNSLLRKPGQVKAPEIPIMNVQFYQELGEGAFGEPLNVILVLLCSSTSS